MKTLEGIHRKIENAEKLLATVKTMKTLAAANVKQYEKAVEALEHFNRTVEMGLEAVLKDIGFPDQAAAQVVAGQIFGGGPSVLAVVFGSDHGFVGRFNDEITSFASKVLREAGQDARHCHVISVGEQAASRLAFNDWFVKKRFSVPNSIAGIDQLIREILYEIEALRTEKELGQAWLFYNKTVLGARMFQEMEMIIPIDLTKYRDRRSVWPNRRIPVYTIDKGHLLSALIQQEIYISLYRGVAFSLAAENSARLATMQAASRNIEELLDESWAEYRQQRQGMITNEILDIAAGATALEEQSPNSVIGNNG